MTRVLFLTLWHPANANRWLAEGFEQIGCEVIRAGTPDEHAPLVEWEDWPQVDIHVPRAETGVPADLAALVREAHADLAFVWEHKQRQLQNVADVPCPVALYTSEGWPDEFAWAESHPVTARYTQMPYGVRGHPDDAFRRGWLYLPGAADPIRHPWGRSGERPVDVMLLGGEYEWRVEVAKHLRAMDLQAATGWRNRAGYARCGVEALVLPACTSQQAYIEWRVFEAMAMGVVVLIEVDDVRTRALLARLGLVAGQHFLPVSTDANGAPAADSVIARVRELRADPVSADRIRRAALARVFAAHTYADRAYEVLVGTHLRGRYDVPPRMRHDSGPDGPDYNAQAWGTKPDRIWWESAVRNVLPGTSIVLVDCARPGRVAHTIQIAQTLHHAPRVLSISHEQLGACARERIGLLALDRVQDFVRTRDTLLALAPRVEVGGCLIIEDGGLAYAQAAIEVLLATYPGVWVEATWTATLRSEERGAGRAFRKVAST